AGEVRVLQAGLDVTRAYSVLFVAVDERLVVYFDGQQVADLEIESGSGSTGIRVQGDGPGATCEASNLWVYRVPVVEPGVCEITAAGGAVNKRSGPGTQYVIAGVLEAGATMPAQAQGSDGGSLVWWQLADGTWVREDVVSEQGACHALPSVS
ncbi:MAG: hypothetical protein K8J31_21360, partial [Anaerolineae bacterium]|nr:hypothetical protein [Anaerolineae bacterium]